MKVSGTLLAMLSLLALLLASACGDDGEIYAMNADGSGLTNLTNSPGDDSDPAWFPAP